MSDHKRAREYFAKAARLDPEDVEAVFWIGWSQSEAGDLVAAEASYARAGELGNDLADKTIGSFGRSWASATCRAPRATSRGALKSYNDGLAIADRLAKLDPSNAEWQRRSFGVVRKGRRRAEGPGRSRGRAGNPATTAFAIRDRLTKSDPTNADWQRDLTVSYDKVGDVQSAQGDLAGSAEVLQRRPRDQKPSGRNPIPATPSGSTIFPCASFNKVGDVQAAQGDLSSALKSYNDGLAVCRADRLAKSDPSHSRLAARSLGVIQQGRRRTERLQGDLAGTLEVLQRRPRDQETVWRNLIPATCRLATRDLWLSFNKVGDVQSCPVATSRARWKSYNDGLAIRDRLARSDPSNAGWQRDLSVAFNEVGNVQSAQGDLAGALKSYNDGFAIADRLAKSDPSNAGWQRDL